MSPTSYQTAPSRDNVPHYSAFPLFQQGTLAISPKLAKANYVKKQGHFNRKHKKSEPTLAF
jgi:hypothetical protein